MGGSSGPALVGVIGILALSPVPVAHWSDL
jgi:hypothetical protein